jgi:hypothetical protein
MIFMTRQSIVIMGTCVILYVRPEETLESIYDQKCCEHKNDFVNAQCTVCPLYQSSNQTASI